MNKSIFIILLLLSLTLDFVSRSQTPSFEATSDVIQPIQADTLRFTPAMIDSLRADNTPQIFERKLEAVTFIPKGQWIAGVSVSYVQSNQDNYQFLVFEKISGDTYTFKLSPKVLYAFRDDMAVGLAFSYQRALTKLNKADIVFGEDTNFDVNYLYSLAHNFYGTALYRNYFSLGRSKRFGFFNEIQAQFGGGQSKLTTGQGESLTGAYERNFSLDIGIVPGIVAFLSNYTALEVNVGVLGYSYHITKTITDRIYVAHRKSSLANFRINLFSVTFGATFYL